MSRREFLARGGATAVATGLASAIVLDATPALATAPAIVGPSAIPIQLRVNGQDRSLTVEPRVTLLDALRDHLDLTGSKKVCDRGTCGACTVHLDGKVVYSCSILAIEALRHEIVTIEGVGSPAGLHPVQAAFVENDAQQCGFCTPGFVMACKALLDGSPSPTPEEVACGLGGNLCRCGTYAGIHAVIAGFAAGKRSGNRG
jgi:aerobic-type carbon monoxide dehydrogenase small subunit (CoxS/CutS family)